MIDQSQGHYQVFEESSSLSLHLHTICFVCTYTPGFAFQMEHQYFAMREIRRLVALRMLSLENMLLRKVKVFLCKTEYMLMYT